MPNEILWLLFVLLDLSLAVLLFRLFGREGLYAVIVLSIIVCNIQVMKLVKLFGWTATLGNALYASIFFATDVLGEVYGKREARKGVWLGFCALILSALYMQMALQFRPAPDDFMQGPLEKVFMLLPRIAAASLSAYLFSQLHDVWAFHFWRRRTGGRHLWLRNNLSTMVSQAIDSLVFCAIAFAGLFPLKVLLELLLTTYVLKWIIALLDTPFIYLARKMAR